MRTYAVDVFGEIAVPTQQLITVLWESLLTQVAIKLDAPEPPDIFAVFRAIIFNMVYGQKCLFGDFAAGASAPSSVSRNHFSPKGIVARFV